ncbi:MAG: glycosyltransferase, partial [bacterium]|nr:glycosyltransferase [bacterium]
VDIIVLGDISELYNQILEGCMLGAIPEQISEKEIVVYKKILKLSKNHNYFNAGILLIDLEQWISKDIMSKLFEIEIKRREDLLHADQDVLYNYETNNNRELEQNRPDIVIRHFNTGIKPWDILPTIKTNLINNIDDFYYYLSKTLFNDSVLKNCKYRSSEQLHKLRLMKLLEKKRIPTIEDCIRYKNRKLED